MTKFSDPAWWPTPPPKPPKAVSTPKLVLGTLLPIAVVGAVIAAVVTSRSHSSNDASGRSFTAFEACMRDQGADTPSVSTNARLMQVAATACKDHLPKGMPVPTYAPPAQSGGDARQAYQECMRSALASLRAGGGGRLGGGASRKELENAVALCRAAAGPGAGRGNATA